MQIDELIENNQRISKELWEDEAAFKGKDIVIEYLFKMLSRGYFYDQLSESFTSSIQPRVPQEAPTIFARTDGNQPVEFVEPVQGEIRETITAAGGGEMTDTPDTPDTVEVRRAVDRDMAEHDLARVYSVLNDTEFIDGVQRDQIMSDYQQRYEHARNTFREHRRNTIDNDHRTHGGDMEREARDTLERAVSEVIQPETATTNTNPMFTVSPAGGTVARRGTGTIRIEGRDHEPEESEATEAVDLRRPEHEEGESESI